MKIKNMFASIGLVPGHKHSFNQLQGLASMPDPNQSSKFITPSGSLSKKSDIRWLFEVRISENIHRAPLTRRDEVTIWHQAL